MNYGCASVEAVKAIDGLNCTPSANAKDQFYRAFEIPMVSREGAAILSTYPLNTECTCQHNVTAKCLRPIDLASE